MIKAMMTALALCVAEQARADALQDRVLAGMRVVRADAYAFQRSIAVVREGAAAKTVVERFDPRRPAAQRWTPVSVDGRAPAPKDLERARKAKRDRTPSYAELARWFGAPATRADGPAGYVVYRFARLPAGTLKIGSHDASADTSAEALVNVRGPAPFVERVRFASAKPFRMMMVARVQSIAATARYRPLPDGTPVPLDTATDMAGSLMGKAGRMRATATFSGWERR